jgi:hypothetical protein
MTAGMAVECHERPKDDVNDGARRPQIVGMACRAASDASCSRRPLKNGSATMSSALARASAKVANAVCTPGTSLAVTIRGGRLRFGAFCSILADLRCTREGDVGLW